jgi:antitoxin component YwqK of YwqJK toxin-antitoxin module
LFNIVQTFFSLFKQIYKMIKQKITFTLIFTIILTTARAQDKVNQYDDAGKRHGLWTKNYYQTDQKRYEGVFVHGKEVDTFKYYRLNKGVSVLSAIKVFNDTDSIAEVIFYASNKKIISKGRMNGKRYIGEWRFYHQNSDILMTLENYDDNGMLSGTRKVYFKNGQLAELANYTAGKLEGVNEWYSEAGVLLRRSQYSRGVLSGLTTHYNSNGNIRSEGNYVLGKKAGIWKYYKDGRINKEIDHTNQKILKTYD